MDPTFFSHVCYASYMFFNFSVYIHARADHSNMNFELKTAKEPGWLTGHLCTIVHNKRRKMTRSGSLVGGNGLKAE